MEPRGGPAKRRSDSAKRRFGSRTGRRGRRFSWKALREGKQPCAVVHGVHRRIGRQIGGCRTDLQRLSRPGEQPTSAAVSEDSVVANPHEAWGQDVEQKPARELGQRKLLMSDPTPAIVLEAKAHLLVVEGDEPVVGDGDPVGIAPPPAGTTQCRCG